MFCLAACVFPKYSVRLRVLSSFGFFGCSLLAASGCWLLAARFWLLLAARFWLLLAASGCSLLAARFWLLLAALQKDLATRIYQQLCFSTPRASVCHWPLSMFVSWSDVNHGRIRVLGVLVSNGSCVVHARACLSALELRWSCDGHVSERVVFASGPHPQQDEYGICWLSACNIIFRYARSFARMCFV